MGYIVDRCRELRNNPTEAESALWFALRKRKRKDFKFLRQFPLQTRNVQGRINFYIADFYCRDAKLVIEVDGGYHQTIKEEDKNRDEVLTTLGLTTFRFTNEEVLSNVNNVVKKIDDYLCSMRKINPPPPCEKQGGRPSLIHFDLKIFLVIKIK